MKPNKAVEAWLESYDNPMKDVVWRVRDTILHADARIKESIKRHAPVFSYRGTLASIFPESKKHASLMFERGAEIPGHHPRLEGSDATGRVLKIHNMGEAHSLKDDLQHLVRSWCDWRDADAAESEEVKARAVKKTAAKKKTAASRKKAARPAAKKARPGKKAARPAVKKAGPRKKVARPAAKKARPGQKAARPAAKSAAKNVSSRQRAARPAATEAGRRSVPPRGLGRQSQSK
jgi:hypothetical protein